MGIAVAIARSTKEFGDDRNSASYLSSLYVSSLYTRTQWSGDLVH